MQNVNRSPIACTFAASQLSRMQIIKKKQQKLKELQICVLQKKKNYIIIYTITGFRK